MCIKKVATTDTFNKLLKTGYSFSLCVGLCPSRVCWSPVSSATSQPVPVAQFCQEMLWCFNMQEKRNPEHSPSLSVRGAPGEPLRIFMGHWFSCFVVKEYCMAGTFEVGAHERDEFVAAVA